MQKSHAVQERRTCWSHGSAQDYREWGAAFDISTENVFHQCKPSSCLENIFPHFTCLLPSPACWQPRRCAGARAGAAALQRLPRASFSGSEIILLFVTTWSCSSWLLDPEDTPYPCQADWPDTHLFWFSLMITYLTLEKFCVICSLES